MMNNLKLYEEYVPNYTKKVDSTRMSKPEEKDSNITSSELWRDYNKELKQIIINVAKKYDITPEQASHALASYFSTEHWKAGLDSNPFEF